MLEAKSLGHGLYEVLRNHEFVKDMCDIMKITETNKQDQLYFIINSGNTSEAQQSLAMLLFCYEHEINWEKVDTNGLNIIHYVCQSGHFKLAQLIFAYLKEHHSSVLAQLLNAQTSKQGVCQ